MQLTDFKILTFDCYGTLIDWESGMFEALKSLIARAGRPLSRDDVLETHARHEAAQQLQTPAHPYKNLLAIVYKRLAEEWRVHVSWDECVAYGLSIRDWPAFPDSAEALDYLSKHYKLAILSNIDNESFSHSNRKLQVKFDAVFTAEDVGCYKPSPRNFEYMLDKLNAYGLKKEEILHTAESLYHDHRPANEFGLASCWIHRRHDREGFGATLNPGILPRYDFRFTSLAKMAAAHKTAVRKSV